MNLLLFILILSVLVFVHELGHFIAARKAGIKVEEFAFGLPFTKPIFSKKRGETVYSIYPLIFGGFVKLYGEDGQTADRLPTTAKSGSQLAISDKQKAGNAYFEKSICRRASVLLAGVTMNLILGIVCFSILYFIWGIPTKTGKILVEAVLDNSPAKLAGIKPKDVILAIDGRKITQSGQLIEIAGSKAGEKIQLEIQREERNPCKVLGGMAVESKGLEGVEEQEGYRCWGGNLLLYLIPREKPPEGEGPLGVIITDTEHKKHPWYKMPFLGVREGFKESILWGKMVLSSLGKMVSSLVLQGRIPKDVAGPIGIYQITVSAAKAGWMAVLQFVGILSVNLAIINILPIPAMDGGRIVFLIYEAIFRKKAPAKLELIINQAGMIFLLALMGLITVNDVVRLVRK